MCPVVLKLGSLNRRWLHLLLGEKTSTWPSLKDIRAAAGRHTKEEGLTGSYLGDYSLHILGIILLMEIREYSLRQIAVNKSDLECY